MDYSFYWDTFIDWCEKLLYSANDVTAWFIQPLNVLGLEVRPLILLTATGLIAYLAIAIVKWLVA